MPRTAIGVETQGSQAKNEATYTSADASNDMNFSNTGNQLLLIKGGATASGEATIVSVTDENIRTGDITQVISANKEYILGPFPQKLFNQSGTNKINVDFDTDTDISLAVIDLTSLHD